MKKATMKDVAKAAGVSVMTVSYALRRHPRISEATAERVRKLAETMGYTPHPFVSALISEIRTHREVRTRPTIAFLTQYSKRNAAWDNHIHKSYREGAAARCEELGYAFEVFEVDGSADAGRRLSKVLAYRKVCGLICAPVLVPGTSLELDWELFPSVAFGHSMSSPQVHRVSLHHFKSMELALDRLTQLGYRRIGLITSRTSSARIGDNFVAAVDIYHRKIAASKRVPVFFTVQNFSAFPASLDQWINKHRPDVVIDAAGGLYLAFERLNYCLPETVAHCTMSWDEGMGNQLAGIDQIPHCTGGVAVDLLSQQIHLNQRGVPQRQISTYVTGVWRDGLSVPRKEGAMENLSFSKQFRNLPNAGKSVL